MISCVALPDVPAVQGVVCEARGSKITARGVVYQALPVVCKVQGARREALCSQHEVT